MDVKWSVIWVLFTLGYIIAYHEYHHWAWLVGGYAGLFFTAIAVFVLDDEPVKKLKQRRRAS